MSQPKPSSPVDPAYRRLPTVGPHEPGIGSALITWVEPMPEHVVAYNRWYEDDHMITGAMSMPWLFSCRRFVAPTWLHHLRGPQDARVAVPLEAGKYIAIYWINEGRLDDHEQWSLGANYRLHAEGRGSCRGPGHDPLEERRHVFTSFSDYLGPTYRDDAVPRDVHTLVQPYQGLVVQVIDAAVDRAELDAWLTDAHLPGWCGGEARWPPGSAPVRCRPTGWPTSASSRGPRGGDRAALPRHRSPGVLGRPLRRAEATIAASGVATLGVQAAFVPTHHGTDDYTDQLF